MKNKTHETIWQEYNLEAVMNHFMKGFHANKGEKIINHEYFVDVIKGKVVVRLFIERNAKSATPKPTK